MRKQKSGVSLIVLVITIIIMIILAAAIIITLSNTGIIGQAERATNEYSKKDATIALEVALADLKKDKYTRKDIYNKDSYVTEKLTKEGFDVSGDTVIVNGWLYIIDREKLIIVSGPEKAKMNDAIKVTSDVEMAADKLSAVLTITITYDKPIKEIKITGGDFKNEEQEIPAPVENTYTITKEIKKNATYVITVVDEQDGLKIANVQVNGLIQDLNIYTKEDLKSFRDNVNSGITYEGVTVILMKDIDLAGSASNKWTPINNFKGTFDGNNKKITGIYVDTGAENQGIFGTIDGGTVKDLSLQGRAGTAGQQQTGLLVGYMTNGKVENVTVLEGSEIVGANRVAGMIGYGISLEVANARNAATVTCTSEEVAGIIGRADNCNVEKAENSGNITGTGQIGGIIGVLTGTGSIKYALNTATLKSSGNYAGGIVGSCENNNITITNSMNYGSVTGSIYIGGICASSGKISCCVNKGSVAGTGKSSSGSYSCPGGIVGRQAIIIDCYNTGTVGSPYNQIGGIKGSAWDQGADSIKNSYNIGTISGASQVGSIVGYGHTSTTTNCYYTTSQPATGDGGTLVNCQKKTPEEMRAKDFCTNLSENFTNDTLGINSGYPILKWELDMEEIFGLKLHEYKITYNVNGGNGNNIVNTYKAYGDCNARIISDVITYQNDEYFFLGWNTKADGTGDTYLPGSNITLTGNITLYAEWLDKAYIVKDGVLVNRNYTWAASSSSSLTQQDGYVELTLYCSGKNSNGISWYISSESRPTKLVYSINNTWGNSNKPATQMWVGNRASTSVHGTSGVHGNDYTYGRIQFCGNDEAAFGARSGELALTQTPENEWYCGFQVNWRSYNNGARTFRIYNLYFE